MKKSIIISAILVLFILSNIFGIILIKNFSNKEAKTQLAQQDSEEILDDCTDEYDSMSQNNTLIEETSTEKEKISPNCSIIFERYYKDCGHTIEQYASIPTELVNKEEADLKKHYEGWTIKEFSKNQIILYREFDSECGEHYILKEKDGKIAIYMRVGDNEEFVEDTDIATEFLTETDKIELQNGIKANGRVELNQLIEDFE